MLKKTKGIYFVFCFFKELKENMMVMIHQIENLNKEIQII